MSLWAKVLGNPWKTKINEVVSQYLKSPYVSKVLDWEVEVVPSKPKTPGRLDPRLGISSGVLESLEVKGYTYHLV